MNRRTAASAAQTSGYVEDVESGAGRDAVEQIDHGLHQQLPADARCRLVKRLRRDGQLSVPEQPDQPVAQISPFEQHEDDHRQHEPAVPSGPTIGLSHVKPEKPETCSG